MLNGITNKNLNMFEVKPQNLSISASNLANIEKAFHLSDTDSIKNSKNFTAKDLGLADDYKVYIGITAPRQAITRIAPRQNSTGLTIP